MSYNPDIAFAIAETLASGELVVIPELTPDHGSVKESKAHIMVQGHISGSAVIQTSGSVIVEGSIMGSFATPCRIEAGARSSSWDLCSTPTSPAAASTSAAKPGTAASAP